MEIKKLSTNETDNNYKNIHFIYDSFYKMLIFVLNGIPFYILGQFE